jgi:O-antigen/teichoic acid export membrane protein
MSNTINIGRKDVLWNYAATFLQIGVGVILLPFILRVFPQETVAIWTIFTTIIALTSLLDFGFNPSFARNVSYVVSGVKELKANGYNIVESHHSEVDYSLFKGLINAMRWFYARVAVILFVLLATAGTYYMHTVLKTYSGSHTEVYIAWAILVAINAYSLYTMYYDSLMQGKGLIKRSKQIQIVGQSAYLVVAVILILLRFNLIAVVSAQALSIIIRRVLSYETIYTAEFKQQLRNVKARARKEILKPVYPNAIKIGLASLGEFLVNRSALIFGGLFLSLNEIASYGLSLQIIMIIGSTSVVYFTSYQPKIAQYKVQDNNHAIARIYLKSCGMMVFTFIMSGIGLVFFGDWALQIIKSQTPLLSSSFLIVMLIVSYLDYNRGMSGWVLVAGNSVPFFKSNLITAGATLCLLFVFLQYTNLELWGLILAQGITQGIYQNWKWPVEVVKELPINIQIRRKYYD